MDVTVADDGLPVPRGPAHGRPVEVDQPRVHRVELDRVEQIGVAAKVPAETRRVWKERMGRDHQAPLARPHAREIGERPDVVRAAEVQQQHVAAFDRPLDSGDQDQATVCRVLAKAPQIELPFVEGNRQRVVAERGGTIDQVER